MDFDEIEKHSPGFESGLDENIDRNDCITAVMALKTELEYQNAEMCRSLLKEMQVLFPRVKGHEFASFFDHAIAAGDRAGEFLTLLLEGGVPADCVYDLIGSNHMHTPIFTAVRIGRRDLIEQLVAAGADLHWCSPTGSNALSEVLSVLLRQASCEDNVAMRELWQWLYDQGLRIDPKSRDSKNKMLSASAQPSSWSNIPLLLEYGISLNSTGWTKFQYDIVLDCAKISEISKLSAEQFRHRDRCGRTPFLLAIEKGDRALAEALLDHGSDLHVRGHCGKTALHVAAENGHASLIPWLIECGISISAKNDFDETALHIAVGYDSLSAASMLLSLGADLHSLDSTQMAVIHIVRYYGDTKMLCLLLEHGANINQICGAGDWPLKDACFQGNAELVKFLLERGADPHLNSTGDTALFAAVIADSLECIKLMIDAGADVNATDYDGWTCLYYLRSLGAAKMLLEHGASPAIADQMGKLPEDWCGIPYEIRQMLKNAR